MEKLYLRANLVAEPLVDNWYAWAHLVSPATACLNMKNRHVPIMKSYIMAPQAHAAAVKNPKMLGGPFIDYEGGRIEEIKDLLNHTNTENSEQLQYAEALEALDKLLKIEAKGYSMQSLYPQVPDILKGYVELTYDLSNNPFYLVKESLLYKSNCYKPSMQSIALYLIHADDDRPFVFSTPRLPDSDKIRLNSPFLNKKLDELYKMEREPQTFEYISEILGIEDADRELFRTFFTKEKPQPYSKYEGDYIRTRYFGHATILIETKDICLLMDPVISYGYDAELARYTFKDLPETIDYVLITHNHQDHVMLETLLRLRHKVKNIIVPRNGSGSLQDPSLKLMLQNCGFENIIEMDELDDLAIPHGHITGFPFFGEHADLDIRAKLGYRISIHDYKILCLADSNNIEPRMYQHLEQIYGDIDVLFLGMECDGAPMSWLYGPYLAGKPDREADQSRRLSGSNYERGIDIVNRFHCKEVYVYAMGQEPWIRYITSVKYTDDSNPIIQSNRLIEDCRQQGIIAERLYGEKELLAEKADIQS